MGPQDSIKAWFDILEERGEHPFFSVLEVKGSEVIDHEFHHGKFDGIGGILKLMGDREKSPLVKPILPARKDPPAWVYFFNFLRYLLRLPFYSPSWNLPKTNWKLRFGYSEKPTARSYHCLSQEETSLIWSKAKMAGAGRNAFMLFHLNKVLGRHQKKSFFPNYWLIPVSLRTSFDQKVEGNFTGFVDARITPGMSAKELHQNLFKSLLRGEAFGGYVGITLGRFLGRHLLKVLVVINDFIQVRTGVFSNLGNWETVDHETLSAEWFGFPPVIRKQPVAGMIGSLNGRQSLCLQFHPILHRDPKFAEMIMQEWVRSLKA